MIAGLVAGVLFGVLMQMMTVPAENGMRMPMMEMVAKVVRSDSIAVGWLYHLFNSAVIGAVFAVVLGNLVRGLSEGAGWGVAYGVFWWVLGAQILMPLLLGMPAFASLRMAPMRMIALGSLIGHIIYGLVLGLAFVRLRRPPPVFAGAGPAR
jgi:uncharacterized membrane protein YagU involved in acid resistance